MMQDNNPNLKELARMAGIPTEPVSIVDVPNISTPQADLADEIAEAISDTLDMDWHPSWAAPNIIAIINRERRLALEKSNDDFGVQGLLRDPSSTDVLLASAEEFVRAGDYRMAYFKTCEAVGKMRVENYKLFTDGMEAAAQICGSLAETTYDDTDAFEAATGCEAAIMRVVKEQRAEQAALDPTQIAGGGK